MSAVAVRTLRNFVDGEYREQAEDRSAPLINPATDPFASFHDRHRVPAASQLRCASQAATMRAPLPDSSAVEPSGFQMRTCADAPSTAVISSKPSEPTP